MSQDTDISSDQSIIHQLPPDISNKIAAGEVIQRPSSVAKELLDNSIDAGADQIKIVIQNAGRTLIQVIDNGCGMAKEDLRPCFQRHATSKIEDVDDLQRIRTLGFRGEAMASIASVSQVTVKTKRVEDEMGFEYEVWGGEEKKLEPTSTDDGTSVAVRNLFYNVPARRQFLKTDATEFRHILRTVQEAAIANTDIGFELVADTDHIYRLPPQDLTDRIVEMFGKSYRSSLIEFEEETSYVQISGLLGDPKLTKKSRGEQFLFVNGRPFQHRYLTYVILNLYDQWTGPKEYPFYAVFLQIDPGKVDVNVHPAKSEVKFEDERSIIQLTKSVVKKSLNEHFKVPEVQPSEDDFEGGRFNTNFGSGFSFSGKKRSGDDRQPVRIPSRINFDTPDGNEQAEQLYGGDLNKNRSLPGSTGEEQDQPKESTQTAERDRNFWQLHNSYIITQTRSGMAIIDQHGAHKRIIYEKTLNAAESGLPSTQQLLFSQTIELSASDFALLKELHASIQRVGFNVELLSGNTAIIQGVPADIDVGDEQQVLKSVLEQYRELDGSMKLNERKKIALAFANKTAIPRGKRLLDPEMEALIDQLFSCDEPYSDPLNKPTIQYIPMDEIQSRFR